MGLGIYYLFGPVCRMGLTECSMISYIFHISTGFLDVNNRKKAKKYKHRDRERRIWVGE